MDDLQVFTLGTDRRLKREGTTTFTLFHGHPIDAALPPGAEALVGEIRPACRTAISS